ncbi:MAG: PqiC family protein [Acidobacteriota bacterium]|jgi:uncharacterized lipoprotein YmbA
MRAVPLLPCLVLLALAGCGSSPMVTYYALDAVPPPGAEQAQSSLGVGPIRFPEYLKRPQIVTRTGVAGLKVDEFNRWGEPLDSAFMRTLTAELGTQLDRILVIEYPFGGGRVEVEYRLLAEVLRFDVDADGTAVLDVSWGLSRESGGPLAAPKRVQYRAGGARPGDYDTVVRVMKEAIADFSRDVASTFREAAG